MSCAEDDVGGARTRLNYSRHGIDHILDAFVRRKEAEGENNCLSAEAKLCFDLLRFEKWEIGDSMRDELDLAIRHVINGTEYVATLLRHDDEFGRITIDLTHHLALKGSRICEDRMKRRNDRHFEARQELDNIAPGFAAKSSVFVLKGDYVEVSLV